MPDKPQYAAGLRVFPKGGRFRAAGNEIVFENCDALALLLNARTVYKPDFKSG